jgi:hypothetical protein
MEHGFSGAITVDELVKTLSLLVNVIPAKAGIQ